MFVVYLIQNRQGKIYIGQTNNLNERLSQHNDPLRKSWASRRGPWKEIFTKDFISRREAVNCERYLKSLKNREKLLEYISGLEE